MDILSDILGALRLSSTLYFSSEFHRPWGIKVPSYRRVARFHLMVRGSCSVRIDGQSEPVLLEAGDLVLIPHGSAHCLADAVDTPCVDYDDAIKRSGYTGHGTFAFGGDDSGQPTRMVCGHFVLDDTVGHALLAQLPPALVIRWSDAVRNSPLQDAFQYIVREVQECRPGYEVVVTRLSEILFVQAIRFWANEAKPNRGLLAALNEPRLFRALHAMHAAPAQPWTLESLGQEAGMGRTAFARSFRDAVGQTPLHYLTTWRVQKARNLLAESQFTIDRIATEVGYDSASSFSRAFQQVTGQRPGAFRRHLASADTPDELQLA